MSKDDVLTNNISDVLNTNEIIYMKNIVSTFNILDIGTITCINEEGRVDVIGNRTIGDGRPVIYSNIEVITPGYNGGGIRGDLTNVSCLILTPSSCMPDTLNQKVVVGSRAFDIRGLKVLPLTKPNATSSLYFHQNGDISLSTENNMFKMSPEEGVSLSSGGLEITSSDGVIGIRGENAYTVLFVDGTFRKGIMKDDKWAFIQEYKNDGSIITYRGSKENECYPAQIMSMEGLKKWESVITTDSSGKITIASGDDLELSLAVTSDSVTVGIKEGCTFKMTKDEVSINGSNLVVSK